MFSLAYSTLLYNVHTTKQVVKYTNGGKVDKKTYVCYNEFKEEVMNEIDANKYFKALDDESFIEDMVDELYGDIVKQLKQVKAENEDLKKQIKSCKECAEQLGKYKVAEQYLNEIEEYIYTDCEYNDGCDRNICMKCKYSSIHDKRILQIIKQAKEE